MLIINNTTMQHSCDRSINHSCDRSLVRSNLSGKLARPLQTLTGIIKALQDFYSKNCKSRVARPYFLRRVVIAFSISAPHEKGLVWFNHVQIILL